MEERMELLMVVPLFQTEFDFDSLIVSKTDDEGKVDSGRGRIRRKLRERRCGQVRKSMPIIVLEIILNERGLGIDL